MPRRPLSDRLNSFANAVIIIFGLILMIHDAVVWFRSPHIHEGERCGPFHHWQDVGGPFGGVDLSCEPDR